MTILLTNADAARVPLADGSVQCVVTSPPYWGLRKYAGVDGTIWPSVTYTPMPGMQSVTVPGDAGCEHVWGERLPERHPGQVNQSKWKDNDAVASGQTTGSGHYCQRCGAWRGMLGLEPTPEMFVAHLVLIFREVWRVLRDDGVVWLNLGDSYASSDAGGGGNRKGNEHGQHDTMGDIGRPNAPNGLKPKDLCMIPARVALALQADGWYLRSDIIWAKGLSFCESYAGSCMPESVTDRPTKAHEHLFLLAKSKRYYYDQEAVREMHQKASLVRWADGGEDTDNTKFDKENPTTAVGNLRNASRPLHPSGRNLRDVWTINPAGYPGSHYAVFPEALVEPCIKAGTSEKGCCPECGAPWERVAEKRGETTTKKARHRGYSNKRGRGGGLVTQDPDYAGEHGSNLRESVTFGFRPTCSHDAEPVPCTVLDPFAGRGTTGKVARDLGRDCVLLDLSHQYLTENASAYLELDKLKAWGRGNDWQESNLEGLPMFEARGH